MGNKAGKPILLADYRQVFSKVLSPMIVVPSGKTLVVPANSVSKVSPTFQLWLHEDAEARTTNEDIDVNNTITPLGPADATAWILTHSGGGPFRELSKTYPITALGAAGSFKGVSYDDNTAHNHSATILSTTAVRKTESRWWLNTNNQRTLGVILSSNSAAFGPVGSNQVYAGIFYNGSSAYLRVLERVNIALYTRATKTITGFPSSSERFVDLETEISADWTTVTVTARVYLLDGTLLDTQSAVWNKGTSIFTGNYKGIHMYGQAEAIALDFCKFYIWGY